MSALPIIAIRQDYLKACGGDHCAAAILNAFEFWTRGKRRKGASDEVWIYKKQTELQADLSGLFGLNKINVALKKLRALGFLATRSNPYNGQDKTLQYRFEAEAVAVAVGESFVAQKQSPETPELKSETLKLKPETLETGHSYIIIDKQNKQSDSQTAQPAASKTPPVPNVLSPAPAAADPETVADSGEFVSGIIQEGVTHGDERNEPLGAPGYDVPAWAQGFQDWADSTLQEHAASTHGTTPPPPVRRTPSPDELRRAREFLPTVSRANLEKMFARHGVDVVLGLIGEAERGASAGRVRNPQGVVIAGLNNMTGVA